MGARNDAQNVCHESRKQFYLSPLSFSFSSRGLHLNNNINNNNNTNGCLLLFFYIILFYFTLFFLFFFFAVSSLLLASDSIHFSFRLFCFFALERLNVCNESVFVGSIYILATGYNFIHMYELSTKFYEFVHLQ